ncbi:MAG: hypothetical protein WC246_00780 [Candidatus Paceibacterota bacterium]
MRALSPIVFEETPAFKGRLSAETSEAPAPGERSRRQSLAPAHRWASGHSCGQWFAERNADVPARRNLAKEARRSRVYVGALFID